MAAKGANCLGHSFLKCSTIKEQNGINILEYVNVFKDDWNPPRDGFCFSFLLPNSFLLSFFCSSIFWSFKGHLQSVWGTIVYIKYIKYHLSILLTFTTKIYFLDLWVCKVVKLSILHVGDQAVKGSPSYSESWHCPMSLFYICLLLITCIHVFNCISPSIINQKWPMWVKPVFFSSSCNT